MPPSKRTVAMKYKGILSKILEHAEKEDLSKGNIIRV